MYYVQQNEKIVLCDNDLIKLKNTLAFMPQYVDLPILETEKEIIGWDGKFAFKEDVKDEIEAKEKERIAKLSLTKREVFLGLYQAVGVTPDQIKAQITDPAALIEFDYANDYYRGNPLIDIVGAKLGITSEQLDKFFETKDYTNLIPSENV